MKYPYTNQTQYQTNIQVSNGQDQAADYILFIIKLMLKNVCLWTAAKNELDWYVKCTQGTTAKQTFGGGSHTGSLSLLNHHKPMLCYYLLSLIHSNS